MTIETHGVVAEREGTTLSAGQVNVIDSYPASDATRITETSVGVSLPQLRVLIERCAGRFNAVLTGKGIQITTLSEDTTATIQAGIVAYTISRTLIRLGRYEQADRYSSEYEDTLSTLREMTSDLGTDQSSAGTIKTNVSLTSPTARSWGTDFDGW